MRAEEGDETIGDYAVEGKQALGRIKDTQHAGGPLGRLVRRMSKFFGGGDRPAG